MACILVWCQASPAQIEGVTVTTSPLVQNAVAPKFDVPADADVAVGAEHVVVIDNHQIHVFLKEGFGSASSWEDEFDMRGVGGFWGPLLPVPGVPAVFDPRVVYDMFDDCFWIVAMDYTSPLGQNTAVYFDIAVTEDGDPTGTWHKFRLDARPWLGNYLDTSGPLDYPNIAVDDDWLYITAWTSTDVLANPRVVESPIWIINKRNL